MNLWPMLLIYLACINFVTWHVWAQDKRAAVGRARRTPERTLLMLNVFGGWPLALLAANLLRHKTSKKAFMNSFWMSVALQAMALCAISLLFR